MKYLVQVSYTNPAHEHVSLRRRVDTVNRIVEAANEEQAILRVSRQQQALGFMVKEAKIVEQKKNLTEEVELNEASKEAKDVMRSVRSSLKSMDLRQGVDSDKRVSGYKMSPAVKAAQAKSDALSKPVKRPQAGTLAAVHKSMEKEMQRSMKKEETKKYTDMSPEEKWKDARAEKDPVKKNAKLGALAMGGGGNITPKKPSLIPNSPRRSAADPKKYTQKADGQWVREEVEYIEEKLTAADPASKWISDFVASDNPKFEGKGKKERIKMALGAHYAAKREKNEAVEKKYNEKEVKNDEKKQERKKGSMNKLNMKPDIDVNLQGVK